MVTLRRLIGKDESEIRKLARDRVIDQVRKQKRDLVVINRRNLVPNTPEEEEEKDTTDFKIIDLENDNEGDFMYFLARKHGNHLYDPDSELNIDYDSSSD
jgi:hypothetical protein